MKERVGNVNSLLHHLQAVAGRRMPDIGEAAL
jgi:hypothetical protein